jgi:hypothetical protein
MEHTMTNWQLDRSYVFRDQAIKYRVTGGGAPLVLIHGTPFSSYVWHRIAPYLSQTRTVFAYDLLGYGQSEMRDKQDVSLGIQNTLLAELLSHWQLDRPDVIAHDFGGATALRAHLAKTPAHSIESCHTQPSMPHARGQPISNSTLPSPSIVPRTLSGPSEK